MESQHIKSAINTKSHWPLMRVSFVPGFIIDFELSLLDVIDALKDEEFAAILAIRLELLYRKLDLRTRARGHLVQHVHELKSLASFLFSLHLTMFPLGDGALMMMGDGARM